MQSAIDKVSIAALRDIEARTGKPLVSRLALLFNDQVPAHLDRMQAALDKGDQSALISEDHACKSMSGNLGAKFMAVICQTIEDTSHRSLDPGSLQVMLDELAESFAEARAALSEYIDSD